MTPDEEHLRLLSIFHYIVAGLVLGVFALFVLSRQSVKELYGIETGIPSSF